MDCIVQGILQSRILAWVAFTFSRGSSQPKDFKPRSPALQADSLSAEPQGKPKNTEVGSLSLLQRIFITRNTLKWELKCKSQSSHAGHGSLAETPRKGNVMSLYVSSETMIQCQDHHCSVSQSYWGKAPVPLTLLLRPLDSTFPPKEALFFFGATLATWCCIFAFLLLCV